LGLLLRAKRETHRAAVRLGARQAPGSLTSLQRSTTS